MPTKALSENKNKKQKKDGEKKKQPKLEDIC